MTAADIFACNVGNDGRVRIIDLAYTAFMRAKEKDGNPDDNGPFDWMNDTQPMMIEQIEKWKRDHVADRATLLSALEKANARADNWEADYRAAFAKLDSFRDRAEFAEAERDTIFRSLEKANANDAACRAELAEAREALKPFGDIADAYAASEAAAAKCHADEGRTYVGHPDHHRVSVSMGDLRRVRAVLTGGS